MKNNRAVLRSLLAVAILLALFTVVYVAFIK